MYTRRKGAPISMLCFLSWLFLLIFLTSEARCGEPLTPGTQMSTFTLKDQHGKKHEVNEQARLILFCKEMKGNAIVSDALKKKSEGYLSQHNTFFVADTSGMPRLVAKFVAMPALRKRPYLVLLDPGPTVTRDFPSEKDKVTLIYLENRTIKAIEFVNNPADVTKAIEQKSR